MHIANPRKITKKGEIWQLIEEIKWNTREYSAKQKRGKNNKEQMGKMENK